MQEEQVEIQKLRVRGVGGSMGVSDKKGATGRKRAAGVVNGRLLQGTASVNTRIAASIAEILPSIHHTTTTCATVWQCSQCDHQNTYM